MPHAAPAAMRSLGCVYIVQQAETSWLLPEQQRDPGFDANHAISTPHRWFTHVHLLGPHLTISPFKLASVLLAYPTQALFDGLAALDAAAADVSPKPAREAFARFLTWLRSTPPTEVAQHYVDTFDLRRRCALYLSYYRYGDTRKRGMSMLTFKATYRAGGFDPNTEELPDYLPMVLDFAALTGKGRTLLCAHRSDLELLRRALQQAGTPYADVVEAVIVQLPGLGRREIAAVTTAWQEGPPREDVGLEPFAPPEYLSGYGSAGNPRGTSGEPG